jgi:aminopeptidase N
MRRRPLVFVLLLTLPLSACDSASSAAPAAPDAVSPATDAAATPDAIAARDTPEPGADDTRDILSIDLALDLTTYDATAVLTLAPSAGTAASFDAGDLAILSVSDALGPLKFRTSGGRLEVGVPAGDAPVALTVRYRFRAHDAYDGWLPDYGVTFLWPYACGNLFPCHPDPAEGQRFTLTVTGGPPGDTLVYPREIPTDVPAYVPAIAAGEFTEVDLGRTSAGTRLRAWHLPGEAAATAAGTAPLVAVFDFLERTYGPYAFGAEAGSVSANWVDDPHLGIEHHPYWHIGRADMGDPEVHAHEAAHGWFGDGVRIACWEDFVLSEGTTTYISARALASAGVDVWPEFGCYLAFDCDPANEVNTVALPDTCGEIDIGNHPLWSTVPYMKGAFFYREVAALLGESVVDGVIADFYRAHVGQAARMQDMLAALSAAAGAQAPAIAEMADRWLRTEACPAEVEDLCATP